MPVVRSELIEHLAASAGIAPRDAEAVLATVLDQIGEALARGDRVELRGFGAFSGREHAARMSRNPRTGDATAVPAKWTVHFKPGKQLLGALNDRPDALAKLEAKREQQRRWRDENCGQSSLF